MADLFEKEQSELHKLTGDFALKLFRIWSHIFDENTCLDNLARLKEHVENFFSDLVEESLQKQALIENEISSLYEEAETLKRLLKTDVQLPSVDAKEMPLLQVQAELDKSLSNLRERLQRRREEIYELLLEQESLCEELGEAPRPLPADPLPTAEEILEFRYYLDSLKGERMERMNKLSDLRREIKSYLQILETNVSTETEDRLLNHREIMLHKETFAGLQRMQALYGARVQEMRQNIETMRSKLEKLWDRLNASPNTRQKFMRHTDCTKYNYQLFHEELNRCEALKSQNIREYVQQIRHEIVEWWDKTLKSETQRSRFVHFNQKCYTDDLLELHEMELEDLKQYYEKNRQIFELYENRKLLWDHMTALEVKANDPGRYNNRGGQLLKEEKERKLIANKLPKIEQKITELVQEYEASEREPFLVHGENILEVMAAEWEKKRQEKEKLSSARKNANTPLSKTQLITTRTPMSMKNTSTASMRKTPSSTNLSTMTLGRAAASSNKRKLHPNEKVVPVAKRSLIYSPSVFLKPSSSNTNTAGRAGSSKLPSKSPFKSPMKKTRVIATTIRRHSGRSSGGTGAGGSSSKKRHSLNRSAKKRMPPPKIVINEGSEQQSDEGADGDYESFQKSIEPDARSSIIQTTISTMSGASVSTRSKRLQRMITDENMRMAHLPNPRRGFHPPTPSKLPSPASTSRKLTTKNLPILI